MRPLLEAKAQPFEGLGYFKFVALVSLFLNRVWWALP